MARSIAWVLVGTALVLCGLAGCKFGDNSGGTTYDGGFDGFAPQGPLLVATPASADFGTVNVGSKSAPKTVSVANVGPGATGALSVSLSGNGFAIDTDGCTQMSLSTTGSCSVSLHFAPTANGAQSATLQISGNPGGDAVVSLTGTGAGAGILSIAPSTNDFGSLMVGSMSAPSTFTVTNKGNGATGAVTVALSGSDATQFAVSADQCSGKSLAALASCTVNVSASPTTPGSKAATLTAQAAGQGGTATASLSANALAGPAFVINPPSYGFGSVTEGTPPGTGKTFTVQNVGAADAGAPAVALSGPNAQDFAIAMNMCTAGLGPLGSCTFAVTFSPTTGMAESAIVTASAAGAMSGQASLSGTGLAPAALTITPSSQPFSPILQGGTPSADVPFQVKNTGAVATGMLTVSLGGTNADQFGLGTDGCTGMTLAAGGTCTVNAHFAPTTSGTGMPGSLQASLQVSGTPGGQTAAMLTGTALGPAALTVSPTSQPLGSVGYLGTGTDFPFVVSNSGDVSTGPITVTISGTMSADFKLGTDGCTGNSLTKGTPCTVYAHFAPGGGYRGAESATLTVSATPGGSVPVMLTGTALAPAQLSFVQPTVPEWGGVGVGVMSPLTFTLQNQGDQPSGSITFPTTGTDSKDFFVSSSPNPCTGPLPGGSSCMLQVAFMPLATGTRSAILEATSTTGGTAQLPVQGTGMWVLTVNVVNSAGTDPQTGGLCVQSVVSMGTVTSANAGVNCTMTGANSNTSNTCTYLFANNTPVSLSASDAVPTGTLIAWAASPGACAVGVPPCAVNITSNETVTATFCGL